MYNIGTKNSICEILKGGRRKEKKMVLITEIFLHQLNKIKNRIIAR